MYVEHVYIHDFGLYLWIMTWKIFSFFCTYMYIFEVFGVRHKYIMENGKFDGFYVPIYAEFYLYSICLQDIFFFTYIP